MTLFADDPDVHIVYPITDKDDQPIDFTPVVKVVGFPDITASWVGPAAAVRDLRVPLFGLPAGPVHRLRLVVPDGNDMLLGDVVLSANTTDYTSSFDPGAVLEAAGYAAEAKGYRDELAGLAEATIALTPRVTTVEQDIAGRLSESGLAATFAAAGRQVNGVKPPRVTKAVTTFQAGHGFTVLGATAAAFADDPVDYALGTQSVKVTTKSDGVPASIQRLGMAALDATGKALTVTARVADVTNVNQLFFYATSDSFTNYYQWSFQADGSESQRWLKSGEHQSITLPFSNALVVGSPNRAALTGFRLRVGTTTGFTTEANYNRVGVVDDTAAVFSFAVDDIYASTWTHFRPALDNIGASATCYAIEGRESLLPSGMDTLHRLEDVNGWEVAGHGLTGFLGMPLADAAADAAASRRWLQANGFRGLDHYAYAGGQFSSAIETMMRRYYRSCRTIVSQVESLPPANPYRLRSTSVSKDTPVTRVTDFVSAAAARGGWYIITFHDITATPTLDTQYSTANLETICAAVAATGAPIRTVGDVLAGI